MKYLQLRAVIFIASFTWQSNCFEVHRSLEHGKEYLLKEEKYNYHEARQLCEANNATLVQIRSLNESKWIKDNTKPKNFFHLGVRSVDGSVSATAPTQFLDGSPIVWYNWNETEPKDSFNCATIHVGPSFLWYKYDCNWPRNTLICERMLSVSSYMEHLVKAVDELEMTIIKDRANITSLLKENKELRTDSAKEVGPALGKVINRIRALTKASR